MKKFELRKDRVYEVENLGLTVVEYQVIIPEPKGGEMKKGKCPECGKEIDYLEVRSVEMIHYRFDTHDGYVEVDREDMEEDMHFGCPSCDAMLTITEEAATKILGLGLR